MLVSEENHIPLTTFRHDRRAVAKPTLPAGA
jgi:hypothetical protein